VDDEESAVLLVIVFHGTPSSAVLHDSCI
jgi:hypothetical protein